MKGANSKSIEEVGYIIHPPIRAQWHIKLDQRDGQFSFRASKTKETKLARPAAGSIPTPATPCLFGVPFS